MMLYYLIVLPGGARQSASSDSQRTFSINGVDFSSMTRALVKRKKAKIVEKTSAVTIDPGRKRPRGRATKPATSPLIVVVDASAQGLETLERLFESNTSGHGMAFLVVQQL